MVGPRGEEEEKKRKVGLVQARQRGGREAAAKIQYGDIAGLEKRLVQAQEDLRQRETTGETLIKEEVDSEQIAHVVARWTGIPVSKLIETEREKLTPM